MNKQLDTLLRASTSRHLLAGVKPAADTETAITRHKGPKGKANSRLIDYERAGPFYVQSGARLLGGEVMPILHKSWTHRFLHATKGWRVYHGDRLYHLPSSVVRPQSFQLFRRSTWRPNRAERKAGLVPRLNTVQQAPGVEYAAGKAVEMTRCTSRRGTDCLGFKLVEGGERVSVSATTA